MGATLADALAPRGDLAAGAAARAAAGAVDGAAPSWAGAWRDGTTSLSPPTTRVGLAPSLSSAVGGMEGSTAGGWRVEADDVWTLMTG